MTVVLVDTSVAVPLVLQAHAFHQQVTAWWAGRTVALSALMETYSVHTRLTGDIRLTPPDAARLLKARFAPSIQLSAGTLDALPEHFGRLGIAGGAVYDGLVAAAAVEHTTVLATRDLRAISTYGLVGARIEYVE